MSAPLSAPVEIADTALIGQQCVLGSAKESRLRAWQRGGDTQSGAPVTVGARCLLFNQIVIYEGADVGSDCVIEDQVRIGYDSLIGSGSRLMYGAYLCDRVTVDANSRVAGFVCDGSRLGNSCTVMGSLVHEYTQPHLDWWDVDEQPPVVEDGSVVGYGAVVVGGVHVGPRSYVAAGAVVTRDVPPEHVVTGVNVHTPVARWPGQRLRSLIRHWSNPDVTSGLPRDLR